MLPTEQLRSSPHLSLLLGQQQQEVSLPVLLLIVLLMPWLLQLLLGSRRAAAANAREGQCHPHVEHRAEKRFFYSFSSWQCCLLCRQIASYARRCHYSRIARPNGREGFSQLGTAVVEQPQCDASALASTAAALPAEEKEMRRRRPL